MSILLMRSGAFRSDRLHSAHHEAEVTIHCRLFGQGREDWNRGLQELRGTIDGRGKLHRLRDGSIRVSDLPCADLQLTPIEVDRVSENGLKLTWPGIEIEIDARSFRRAVCSLPASAEVRPLNCRI